ncbi:DUF4188 domain-containing protein [Streptomonospora sediminis]
MTQPSNDTKIPRMTNEPREHLTVFLLGTRINALFKPQRWVWVLRAFRAMAAELEADPARGLLYSRILPSMFGVTVIQYWESTDALLRYAHDETHSAAWKRFYRQGGDDVGIWHETYEVGTPQSGGGSAEQVEQPEQADGADPAEGARPAQRRGFESVYANMPTMGLGRALGTRPIGRGTQRSLDRLAVRRARAAKRAARDGADDRAGH